MCTKEPREKEKAAERKIGKKTQRLLASGRPVNRIDDRWMRYMNEWLKRESSRVVCSCFRRPLGFKRYPLASSYSFAPPRITISTSSKNAVKYNMANGSYPAILFQLFDQLHNYLYEFLKIATKTNRRVFIAKNSKHIIIGSKIQIFIGIKLSSD